ncbi:recombinase family protein [Kribbella sp. NPDC050470]|uniref:recombinase family protein n=1 Tax=unclassified Kribbella TaxID=2644121 RepID=UPI0037A7B19A
MTRARMYLRISNDREGREIGVGRQEETCRELASRLKAELVEPPYVDNDAGASTLSKASRPDYDRLLQDAEDDPGSLILAYSNSRLTRRPFEWEHLIRLHERARVTVHTWASGTADLSKADGRAVARTIAAWDAAEAERTGERVKEDVERRAKAGLFHGGGRSFGWTVDHELEPGEAAILEDWVDRLIAGEDVRSLSREAIDKGIPTVRGGTWRPSIIRQMVINPRIAGLRALKGEIKGKAVWPAIVPREKWEQVVRILEDPARRANHSTTYRVHLLTGLALCDQCDVTVGSNVTSSKKNGRRVAYICWQCGMSRDIKAIDLYAETTITALLEHYEEKPPGVDPKQLQAVQALRDRIEAVKEDFATDDTADPADLRETLRLLRGRLKTEEAKIAPRRQDQVVKGVTGDQAAGAWRSLPLSRKRAIIDALVEVRLRRGPKGRVPFDPETVQIVPR